MIHDIREPLFHMFDKYDIRRLLLENEYFVTILLQECMDPEVYEIYGDLSDLSESFSNQISAMYKGLGVELYHFIGNEMMTLDDQNRITRMLQNKGMSSFNAHRALSHMEDLLGFSDANEWEFNSLMSGNIRRLLLENEYYVAALLQTVIGCSDLSEELGNLISAMYKGLGIELYYFIGNEKPTQEDWVRLVLMLHDKGMSSDKAIGVLQKMANVLGFDGNEFEWSVDYQKRCGNCHKHMDENARYCSFCGTPKGKGTFSPYKKSLRMYVLHDGPFSPENEVELSCEECGRRWKSALEDLEPKEKYCSQCGKVGCGQNLYFEIALFKYLYSCYDLQAFEKGLCNEKCKPLLNTQAYCSTISKYFRLMNKINYSILSFAAREYIAQYFTKEIDVEQNWNKEKSVTIYQEVIKSIHSKPEGYTEYRYDGYSTENVEPIYFAGNYAPNNYITFGIYYTRFDKDADSDSDYDELSVHNQRIAVKIANRLQENEGIAVLLFSEIDQYREAFRINSVVL